MPTIDYTRLVDKPSADSINTGRSNLHQATMLEFIGPPSPHKTPECTEVTNPALKPKLVTQSVGPFAVTGHRQAVHSLAAILAEVKVSDPNLYAQLGTAGMLCARLVRGSTHTWSNHSWGFAVDLTIGGILDHRGDNKVQLGLMRMYPFFHHHGWWWGAEFPTEDGMHFEVSDEQVRSWESQGLL